MIESINCILFFFFGILSCALIIYVSKISVKRNSKSKVKGIRDKTCPFGHKPVDLLFSMNKLWCFECKEFYDFKLKKGKKSILIKNLKGE